jgi:hypothetical protein
MVVLSKIQLKDLINSVVKQNNRKAIDGIAMNQVLQEIVDACFNTAGENMANTTLAIDGNRFHDGDNNLWGIGNLSKTYFVTSGPADFGASHEFQGFGTGTDNQIFSIKNGAGNSIALMTGDLRTKFGGNIAVGTDPFYARVAGVTSNAGEYGGLFQSQFNIGVRGTSDSNVGIQGESTNYFGVYGISTTNKGVVGVGETGGYFYSSGFSGVGLEAVQSSGAFAFRATGKMILNGLPTSPLTTNEIYIYDDGVRKYLCIN